MKNDLRAPSDTQHVCHRATMRYLALNGEQSVHDINRRVAGALADTSEQEARFITALNAGFIPSGGVNAFAGVETSMSMIDCFVQPVGDAVAGFDERGRPGIFTALAEAAETIRLGGAVGYDFSAIRPAGAGVSGTHAHARGPIGFMQVFDQMGSTLSENGNRLVKQMAVLRVDHPDIEAFIGVRQEVQDRLGGLIHPLHEMAAGLSGFEGEGLGAQCKSSTFKLAVAVTDEFMTALVNDRQFELVHVEPPRGKCEVRQSAGRRLYVHRVVRARELWSQIMRNNHAGAELGVLFIDRIKQANNLRYVEDVVAASPGGNMPLSPYGGCGTGSVDVARFVVDPYTPEAKFQHQEFRACVRVAVEMLNQVLDKTRWPLTQQLSDALSKRRIGLGPMGVADAMAMMGMRYGSKESIEFVSDVMRLLRDEAYAASVDLAQAYGSFPLFDATQYLSEGTFASGLPEDLKERIRVGGIRNSHLLCVAASDVSTLAMSGNASSGIEPVPAHEYLLRDADGGQGEGLKLGSRVHDDLRMRFGSAASLNGATYASAGDLSADDHLAVLAAAAAFVDAAVSKVVYVPENCPLDQFEWVYFKAWSAGLKGLAQVIRMGREIA